MNDSTLQLKGLQFRREAEADIIQGFIDGTDPLKAYVQLINSLVSPGHSAPHIPKHDTDKDGDSANAEDHINDRLSDATAGVVTRVEKVLENTESFADSRQACEVVSIDRIAAPPTGKMLSRYPHRRIQRNVLVPT